MSSNNGTATQTELVNDRGIIAVPAGNPNAGAVVWWTLSGEIDLVAITKEWEEQGLDPALLPEAPSEQAALRRAMYRLKDERTMVRSLDKATSAWAVVSEHRGNPNERLDYSHDLTVKRDENDKLVFEPSDIYNEQHPTVMRVRAEYSAALGRFDHIDIGAWLARSLLPKLDAVPLRDRGGVYFVPQFHVDTLHKVRRAIANASACRMQEIPAMKDEDAVAAVLDAVRREAEDAAKTIEDAVMSGDFGKRGLEARAQTAADASAKVRRYETLLGAQLDELRKRLDDLQSSAAMAALACDVDEAKA